MIAYITFTFSAEIKATTGGKILCLGPQVVALDNCLQDILAHGTYIYLK